MLISGLVHVLHVIVKSLVVIAVSPQRAGICRKKSCRGCQICVLCVVEVVHAADLIKAGFPFRRKTISDSTAQPRFNPADIRLRETAFKQRLHKTYGIARFYKLSVYKPFHVRVRKFGFLQIGKLFTAYQFVPIKIFPEGPPVSDNACGKRIVPFVLIFAFPHQHPVFKAVIHNKTTRNYMVYFTFGQFIDGNRFFAVHRPAQLYKPQIQLVIVQFLFLVFILCQLLFAVLQNIFVCAVLYRLI